METDSARLDSATQFWRKMAESFRSPRKIARRLKYIPLAIRKILESNHLDYVDVLKNRLRRRGV